MTGAHARARPDGAPIEAAEPTRAGGPPDESAAAHRRSWGQVLAGTLVVAAGALWLLDSAAELSVAWRYILPAALVVVGLATVTLALRRSAADLIGIGVVLTVLVVVSALTPARIGFSLGERAEQPTSVAEAAEGFGHGVGSLEIDLRRLAPAESLTVEAGVGIGELRVLVPPGVPLDVRATASVGDVEVFERRSSGVGSMVEERFDDGDGPTLQIEASVGVGRVQVVRP